MGSFGIQPCEEPPTGLDLDFGTDLGAQAGAPGGHQLDELLRAEQLDQVDADRDATRLLP